MTSLKIRRAKLNKYITMSTPLVILRCKSSSPTGEGATHVNIFLNYCKITKYKCVARWGLARKGGVICYQ